MTEGVKSLQGIGRVLDPRLDLLGSAQMAVSEVDTFQRFLDLVQGDLERVIAGDNFLAVAVRSSDFVALAPPSFQGLSQHPPSRPTGLCRALQWRLETMNRDRCQGKRIKNALQTVG